MKTLFRFVAVAFAASMALVSCSKENINKDENIVPAGEGERIISVSFSNNLKSKLQDGSNTKPEFVDGDEIAVSDGKDVEKCIVEVKKIPMTTETTAIIRTSFIAADSLTAVYPYEAAIIDAWEEGDSISGVTLSKQDGTFAKANIAMAGVKKNDTVMDFKNQTALLKVTLPEGTKTLMVKSLTDKDITEAGKILTIGSTEKPIERQDGISYVAILPGVNLSDLSFDAAVDETNGSIKGIPAKTFATEDASKNMTKRNSLYTINANNWHPYVLIGGKKWATCNLGATGPEDIGYYYAWGDTQGYVRNSANTAWVKPGTETIFDGGFCWRNTPFNNNSTAFDGANTTDLSNACPDGVLSMEYDAARQLRGGSWRMPTKDEFKALLDATYWKWYESPKGYYVFKRNLTHNFDKFGNSINLKENPIFDEDLAKKDALFFLPASGFGKAADNANGFGGVTGCNYWLSSILTYDLYKKDKPEEIEYYKYQVAFYIKATNEKVITRENETNRFYGFVIRPVSD